MEPKQLYRTMEAILDEVEGGASAEKLAAALVPRVLETMGPSLGIVSAHVYRREEEVLDLLGEWGASAPDLRRGLEERLGGASRDATREYPWAEKTEAGFAGVVPLDREFTVLMALLFDRSDESGGSGGGGAGRLYFLAALHHALGQHLRRRDLESTLEQARAIQMSLLPPARPSFCGYDIAAACVPALSVGGDLYEFIHLDTDTLAFAVADAAGHGLPAALQARDVTTGLRMGVERDLRITRTVEKLNRVIHDSGLVSRFVSLFFGELEGNGSLTYVNAGHPPPLLLDGSGFHPLTIGGMILGPQPGTAYKLGFAHMDRGASLALFSDGVIERQGIDREFGIGGVKRWMTDWAEGPADQAVADLLVRLRASGGREEFRDDVTVVYLRRPR
jgi:sigma-B regulation protein RsbU (phosphoserine phosphatase)